MAFRQQLRQLRIEHKLSQQDLADAIYVSRSAVAKWENGLGLPSSDCYEALLRFFAVSDKLLLIDEDEYRMVSRRVRQRGHILRLESMPFFVVGALGYYIRFADRPPHISETRPADAITFIYLIKLYIRNYISSLPLLSCVLLFGAFFLLGVVLMYRGFYWSYRSVRRDLL